MKRTTTFYMANRKVPVFAMIIAFLITIILPIHNVHAQGTYYVGGSGASDSNPGTSSQPFATIQKAATVAVSGSIVNIRTGTYRETVTPANSGVTYQPDGGAAVVISGLNTADGGWTVYSGNIYKKTITLPVNGYNLAISSNTTLAANQVFKGGKMMIEARWPKADSVEALFNRANFRQRNSTVSWNETTLVDNGIPNIAGGWGGAKIWVTGWFIAQSRTVSTHSGSTITYPAMTSDLRFLQYYYLTGKLGALTQAKEWHYENNTLYFWQEGGGSPTGIEYKARNWGFDLRGKSNITIKGIELIGCEINGDLNTSNVIIDNIRGQYLNHTVLQEGSDVIYYNALQTGIRLLGPNNVVKNSEFKYAASQGVHIGEAGIVQNNKFSYINYEGNYGAPVLLYNTSGNQKILNNTIHDIGRSAIDFGYIETGGQHLNVEIGYNDLYNFGTLSADGGAIYAARYQNLTGTRVHHNWIHNSKAAHTPSAGYDVGINAGIYYDQATGSGTINDHNVLWDNRQCDFHVSTYESNPSIQRGKAYFYNNTAVTKIYDDYVHGYFSFLNIATAYYDVMRNNIFRARLMQGDFVEITSNGQSPFDATNNLLRSTDPLFTGGSTGNPTTIANPESYFQLQTSSPGKNTGIAISGITDGSVGTPDIGAYENGGTAWVPGYNQISSPSSGDITTTLNDTAVGTGQNQFEYVGTGWGFGPSTGAYLNDEHYTATTNDYYQVDFTGTQIQVYSQKYTSAGIAAYSIDGGPETLVDQYNPTLLLNTLVYTSPALSSGSHTLKVRVTGTKNASSSATWLAADRVVITASSITTTTLNDTAVGTGQNQFEYVGTGWGFGPSTGAYLNDEHYTATTNDYYQVDFTGTQIQVYSQKYTSAGIAAYSIDGGAETLVDQYNPTLLLNTLVYTSPTLSSGSHTLKVRVTGTKNASSSATWLAADRVVITVSTSGNSVIDSSSYGVTEIAELQNSNKSIIYPNPGNGRFSLKSSYNIEAVEIFNISGRKVYTLKNVNRDRIKEINISSFSNGIYFVKLFNGKKYFIEKVIKKN